MAYDKLSDDALEARLHQLVKAERESTAEVLACLGEFDARSLAVKRGTASTFVYAVMKLKYAEGAAYRRLYAARAARLYPEILSYVRDGSLSLSVITLIQPHLTRDNASRVIARMQGKTKREADRLLAEVAPQPDVPDMIKLLPAGGGYGQTVGPTLNADPRGPAEIVRPTAPARYLFRFSGDEGFWKGVRRLRELLSHRYPEGKVEQLLGETVLFYLDANDPLRKEPAKPRASDPHARRPPQSVKDAVARRDGGRCAFIGPDGSRCAETRWLDYDHIEPWSLGGASNTAENIRLLCGPHNQLERERRLGPRPPS